MRPLSLALAAWMLLTQLSVAGAQVVSTAPAAHAGTLVTDIPEILLARPTLRDLGADLADEGFVIVPNILEQRPIGDRLVTVLPVEVTRPRSPANPQDEQWTRAVPLVVMVFTRDGVIDCVVQSRLDTDQGLSLMEFRFPQEPRVRVRVIDPTSTTQGRESELQLLAQLPGGAFDRVIESPGGELSFLHHPSTPVPDFVRGFWSCVKDCFLAINVHITWFQVGCIAGCLIGAGIAALASAGSAIVPVLIACLKICGLACLIARAATLASCIIACL